MARRSARLFGTVRGIRASTFVEFGAMINILVEHCVSKERLIRLTAVQWVDEFIKLGVSSLLGCRSRELRFRALLSCVHVSRPAAAIEST